MKTDYYKVLGVTKSATHDDIKAAFKKLARKYHPDVNPGKKEAEEKFKEVSEAYEVLGDPAKRKQYDQFGSFNFGQGGPQNPYSQNYWQSGNFSDIDLEDIFGDIFGMGGVGGGRRKRGPSAGGFSGFEQQQGRHGSDIHWTLPLTFLEAVNGTEKQILLTDGKKVKVKIPAGVETGSKIRLAGKGNPGVAGGKAGDLLIETQVQSHELFERRGDDILLDYDLPLAHVLEGIKAAIPTIAGNVQMTIPAGTQSGQKLRLKGRGVPNLKTQAPGDQYVRVNIKYPQFNEADRQAVLDILKRY